MKTAYDQVREHTRQNAQYNKRYYDVKVRPKDFKPGQWVWYLNLRKALRKQQKWISQYEGPYLILHMLSPLVAEIQKNWRSASTVEHSSSMSVHHKGELLIEQPSSMSRNASGSTVEHSSSTLCKCTIQVEHPSSTSTESTRFDLDEFALILMDRPSNSKTADKATQIPEKQPYVCYVCGHEDMGLAYHRQHMLSLHRMDLVTIAVVYDDNLDASQ